MGNGRLALCTHNLSVEMVQSAGSSVTELECRGLGEGLARQEIKERTQFTVVCDEPELHLQTNVAIVCRDESQDVRMTEETGLVDLYLVKPGELLLGVEYLDCHLVSLVHTSPHLSETTLPYEIVEGDLT